MTGAASPEKASSSKKKSERKCATKEEYRQLSSIMGVMNSLRKQVCVRERKYRTRVYVCKRTHEEYTVCVCPTLS